MDHKKILILDFGSQYTQLIARRVRELGYYSVVISGEEKIDHIKKLEPSFIILSGGPASVSNHGAPQLDQGFWEFQSQFKIPVLGICYGLQLIVKNFGGEVEKSKLKEYGRVSIKYLSNNKKQNVWMSHGDHVKKLPLGFKEVAQSESGIIASIENVERKVFGLQFHPEVTHTESGTELILNFLNHIADLKPDWNMRSVFEEQIKKIKNTVKSDEHILCALSGGVDSTVAACLVYQAIGDRLHCVFVDHGLLRYEEQKRVMKLFNESLHLPVDCVDAQDIFYEKLKNITDPEEKRKIIGEEFIRVFERFALELKKTKGIKPKYLVQGTLYPDVIESSISIHSKDKKFSSKIKSHHNVGGLPEKLDFKLIEPLRDLFKDEVRELGKVLKVSNDFLRRHPFPGPGLAVRIIGEITPERIKILQMADEIFIQSLKEAGLYDLIWQAFCVFLPIKSVGVQGDGRTHEHVIALRAVTSSDGMTADWYHFNGSFLAEVSNKICNQVNGVNRVVYDISSKPPATIEWE